MGNHLIHVCGEKKYEKEIDILMILHSKEGPPLINEAYLSVKHQVRETISFQKRLETGRKQKVWLCPKCLPAQLKIPN